MPQDSIIISTPTDTFTVSSLQNLPDSIRVLLPPELWKVQPSKPNGNEIQLVWIILIIVIIAVLPPLVRLLWEREKQRKYKKLIAKKGPEYDLILRYSHPYYRKLSADMQVEFLKRTIKFIQSKNFEYVGLKSDERMPLLISAAAIQLTFGLQHYLLDHFKTIFVMERSYHYGFSSQPFEGHVNYNGIYLSWDSFSKQFEDYKDGSNVGLHEMAHALAYVNFSVDDGLDPAFRARFFEFSKIARPIFNDIQKNGSVFLGTYATTNYNEFWAVCVENFFERPETFQNQLPELYKGLCILLNQDPVARDFIIMPLPG